MLEAVVCGPRVNVWFSPGKNAPPMSDPSQSPSYKLRRPGGEVDPSRVFNAPGVVLTLAGATCLVFALTGFLPARVFNMADSWIAVSPQRFLAGPEANGGLLHMLSPLIGHMFMHASLPHILFNMLWLLALGTPVARRMGAENALQSASAFAGAVMFLIFYLLCGVVGALIYIAAHANEATLMVGASGAVSGLLGAVVRFAFNRSTFFGPEKARLSPLSDRTVWIWSAFIIIMNIVIGVFGAALTGGMRIAWEAHVGGFIFGLLTYPLFDRVDRQS